MKKLTRLLAAALCLAMLFSLAACGKDSGEQPKETEGTPTPEYVYVAEYTPIREGTGSLSPIAFADGGFYAMTTEFVDAEGNPVDMTAVPDQETAAADGEAAEEPETGEEPEAGGEGNGDAAEKVTSVNVYHFIGFDGSDTVLDKYAPVEAPENTEGYKDYETNSYINGLLPLSDGTLLALETVYVSYYDGPAGMTMDDDGYWEHYQSLRSNYLRHLDASGAELSSTQLFQDDENVYLGREMVEDEKGNLVMTYTDSEGNWGVLAVTREGETVYNVKSQSYVDSLVRLSDGRAASGGYGDQGMELKVLDAATGKFTDTYKLPNEAYNLIPGGAGYDFYYTSGTKLYGYELETGEKTEILDWIGCDVPFNDLSDITVSGDGVVSGVLNHWRRASSTTMESSTSELVVLTKQPYDSIPQKRHLTLACMYLDYDVQDVIVDFNRSHDDVRIDVVDYSQYNTDDDYSAGVTKLNTEIMAGKVPDLLCMSGLPYDHLASKGLLADLYPFMDADEELNRDAFFSSILKALEVDGGLYQICNSFSIETLVGSKKVVGDRIGWTYQDVLDALEQMPEGCDILDIGATKDSVLSQCLAMDMENLVDWSEGKCSFDSPEFLQMLEFANRFKDEFDYDDYDYENDSGQQRVQRGEQMLLDCYIYDFTSFQEYDYFFGGTDQTAYIGWPTSDGSCGSALLLSSGYAIGANCADKDAAWEFIRSYLLGEGNSYNLLPTTIEKFNQMEKEAMTPEYVVDEDGNKREVSHMSIGYGNGIQIDIYAMSQAQADQLAQLIDNASRNLNMDEQISQIVTDETKAYFTGQKSAEEVAKLIQSKVNIYVNEQK